MRRQYKTWNALAKVSVVKRVIKILDICIMKLRMDVLHYALLAVVVLLAVYVARGSGLFREGAGHESHKKKSDKYFIDVNHCIGCLYGGAE